MDTLVEWLPRIGAILTLIIGLVGFFKPRAMTNNLQIELGSNMAMSEARVVFGGLNLGAAIAALLLNSALVYITLGVAWFFGLLARCYSMLVDKTSFKDSLPGMVVDASLSFLFLSGLLF
ncbi:MAG: DUF4345 family protein [Marinobacter sp.]|uniref:DUF4345 family protein n=1 Tax=Marinobacter sp. TaxID=50741 RepID=UPI003298471C